MNHHHAALFTHPERMQHCIVLKKVGQCTVYELYEEESNTFLLACVTCVLLSPMLLFITTPDCHLRKFEDICCNLNIRYFVAKMLPDWMTGLNYKLTGFDESLICEIKIRSPILTSAPISFTMKVKNPDYDPDDQSNASSVDTSTFSRRHHHSGHFLSSLFSCVEDINCLDGEEHVVRGNGGGTTATAANAGGSGAGRKGQTTEMTMYTSISNTSQNKPIIELETRPPVWNSEIRQYTDHYGGRVRVPSRLNFMVVYNEEGEFCQTASASDHLPGSGLEGHSFSKICIRHGKTNTNTFILDYRSPATALTSFAAMCAIHS
eukprot:gene8093-8928_t